MDNEGGVTIRDSGPRISTEGGGEAIIRPARDRQISEVILERIRKEVERRPSTFGEKRATCAKD